MDFSHNGVAINFILLSVEISCNRGHPPRVFVNAPAIDDGFWNVECCERDGDGNCGECDLFNARRWR